MRANPGDILPVDDDNSSQADVNGGGEEGRGNRETNEVSKSQVSD